MARPVTNGPRALLRTLRGTARSIQQIRPQQWAFVGAVVVMLVLGWLISQAWLSARSGLMTGQGSESGDVAQGLGGEASNPQEARPAPGASLVLSPDALLQEGELSISGSGFGPWETVVISSLDQASGEAKELDRASTDWRGSLTEHNVKLPEWLTSGARTIEGSGERSGSKANATLYVRAKKRWANLSSFGIKQAERLGFITGGFEPEEKVNVYLAEGQDLQPDANATPVLTVPTDRAGGSAWTEFQVPLVKAGNYSLMWRGESGGEALSLNIVINALVPSVELSPWSGPPGARVDLNGTGFVPGEEVGVYLGDSTEPALSVTSDENGSLWGAGPVTIPYEARGPFRLTLIGGASHALVTRSFGVVAPKPWVELSIYAGFAGTSVLFSGGGFAAGEQVTIHLEQSTAPTIFAGQANDQGYYRFLGPVNVPPSATEEVTFVLVGESSHAVGSATFKVLTPWVPSAPSLGR